MNRFTNEVLIHPVLQHQYYKKFPLCVSVKENLLKALNNFGFSSLFYIYFRGMTPCSPVLELYFSYLTCTVSPATAGNYRVEFLKSSDPLLECTFSSTYQSSSVHYLWSLDDIAQFCMSNSHFSLVKFSLHDILDC